MKKAKVVVKRSTVKRQGKIKKSKSVVVKVSDPTRALAIQIAHIADEHKAVDIAVLELTNLSSFTDYFIVCSGTSDRHVQSIADAIRYEVKKIGRLPLSEEGIRTGRWALIDYGEVVAHVFYAADREYYQLERLWHDAPRITIEGVS